MGIGLNVRQVGARVQVVLIALPLLFIAEPVERGIFSG